MENVIKKSDLIGGRYYIGRTFQRGMYVGLWDSTKQVFYCINAAQWGGPMVYHMPHVEDKETNLLGGQYVSFEPVKLIEMKPGE